MFIKEIVPKAAVAWMARRVYNENYVAYRMRSRIELPDSSRSTSGVAEYGWEYASQRNSMRAEFRGNPSPAASGSEEEFITEHYWGYTRQRDGGTIEYHVDHPPWRVWRASSVQFTCDVESCYGAFFVEPLARPPTSAFVADGSAVTVFRGERIGT